MKRKKHMLFRFIYIDQEKCQEHYIYSQEVENYSEMLKLLLTMKEGEIPMYFNEHDETISQEMINLADGATIDDITVTYGAGQSMFCANIFLK